MSDPSRPFDWQVLNERPVFENDWIRLTQHDVVKPGGVERLYTRLHWKRKAVGVVALDRDGSTWIVGQHRFPFRAWSWEVPEGGSDPGEDPLETAKRELKEEVGVTAGHWREVLRLQLSNALNDEVAFGYLATDVREGAAEPEESELLEVRRLPFRELARMVLAGDIQDAITVALVLKLQALARAGDLPQEVAAHIG